jgi:hypothetical protein
MAPKSEYAPLAFMILAWRLSCSATSVSVVSAPASMTVAPWLALSDTHQMPSGTWYCRIRHKHVRRFSLADRASTDSALMGTYSRVAKRSPRWNTSQRVHAQRGLGAHALQHAWRASA